ncbi:MAG: sulfite exporter TauE/SafE family protein [Gammaproteobacteria bacterium]|nr:sulfite exporter TauE/SafE family protein [Gammaproteobacteria bacterium]
MDFQIAYTVAGFAVGFIVGLTGVGGGSLMTPVLVLLFNFKPAVAVGTDLLYAAITKSGGIFVHHRKGNVDWRIVRLLAAGSIPASLLSLLLLRALEAAGVNYDRIITLALAVALILTSSVLMFRGQMEVLSRNESLDFVRALHRRLRTPMTVVAGACIGFFVTLSSVGAGALGAAILFFLYPRMRPITIVGTDLAHAVPITAIAGLGHAHLGTVNYELLASLLLGSLPGIYLGSHTGANLPDRIVRPILAGMLLLIGVRMVL